MGELATADISKLDLSRQAFRLVPAFPIFGVGRGAFESVFPAFRSDTGHIVYSHPENIVAQWMTEWGVVPALLAFGVLLVALRPSAALARSPRAAGAWTAIVCVAVQNLVDFGSEFPAVVLALTTCAAIVTGGTSGEGEPRLLDGWARRPSLVVATSLVAAAASAVLMLPTMHHELFDDRAALHASALDPSLGRVEFERRAEAAMLRHPAEPYLPFTGALHAVRAADGSLLPWIERTLDRAVVYGPAHLLLARWLTPRSPGQARLEYRLALEQAPEFLQYVQAAAPGLVRGYDDATELIPHGPHSAYFAEYLASAVANRLPATARRLDDLVERKDPDNLEFAARRANEAFGDVISSDLTPWCQGDQRAVCLRDALERTSRLIRLSSARCAGHSMHARLLLESGEPQRALRELRTAAETVTDRTWCYEELADLALFARSDEVVNQALERVGHAGCADDTECVRNLRFVASRERARGNERLAFAALQRARTKAPEDDGLLEEVAALAAKVDLHAEALRGYQTLAVRHPGDARWPAAVAAENLAIVKGSIRP